LPGIDWSANLVKSDSSYKAIHEYSLEILHDHALQQLLDFPTHLLNTLDLVATNKPSSVFGIHKMAGISDYNIVLFEIMTKVKLNKQSTRIIYMYGRANLTALKEELHILHTIDDTMTPEENVEQLWSKFKASISQVVDKYIPHKLTKKRSCLPWINQNIRKLIRKRDRLYKLCKVSFSEAKYADFKSLKHLVQKEIRSAYWSYTTTLIAPETHSHLNQKKFWSYIKAMRKENTNISVLKKNNTSYKTSLDKTKIL